MKTFKERWIDQACQKIQLMYPEDDENEIRRYLSDQFDKDYKENMCTIYNNYEKEEIETPIYNLFDWIETHEPILTESGTMFKQHSECFNPNIKILNNKLMERKVEKKKKFKFIEEAKTKIGKEKDECKYLAKKADLAQLRYKVIANSEYGVSGLRSSWFFNMACASATTARGQALISTAFNAFENFLADNVLFMNMNECVLFINNIVHEKDKRTKKDSKWVKDKYPSDVYDRLLNKFLDKDTCDEKMLQKIICNLSQENLNRIYYKCNMYEFFRNSKKATKLLLSIVSDTDNFINPNKPPKHIKENIDKLKPVVIEYVHYNYPTIDRTYRLKTQVRKAVIVIDTDSNFINLHPFVEFVFNELMDGYKIIRRNKKEGCFIIDSRDDSKKWKNKYKEQATFRIINTMVVIITEMLDLTLDDFLDRCKVKDKSVGLTNMKNEFYFSSILLTPAKKHYQSAIKLQEGVMYPDCEFDNKGMEYMKKSMAGETTRNFIKDLVFKDILLAKDHTPNIPKILKKLRKFEKNITDSVINGDDEYLKTSNVKTEDAYSDPLSIGPYKAVYVWNYLYPDNKIELPGIAKLLKVNLGKPKDFAQLSVTDPVMFEKLMELFNTNERIAKSGITTIAIPIDDKPPKWIIPYINLNEIVANNEKLLLSILNTLDIKTIYRTKGTQFFSNIIDL